MDKWYEQLKLYKIITPKQPNDLLKLPPSCPQMLSPPAYCPLYHKNISEEQWEDKMQLAAIAATAGSQREAGTSSQRETEVRTREVEQPSASACVEHKQKVEEIAKLSTATGGINGPEELEGKGGEGSANSCMKNVCNTFPVLEIYRYKEHGVDALLFHSRDIIEQ